MMQLAIAALMLTLTHALQCGPGSRSLLPATAAGGAAPSKGAGLELQRVAAQPRMIDLPMLPGFPFVAPAPRREVLREDGKRVDFTMESVHLTKRRVSGGVSIDASPEAVWSVITDYEAMPDFLPNIISQARPPSAVLCATPIPSASPPTPRPPQAPPKLPTSWPAPQHSHAHLVPGRR